ncbi:hypothetical protein GCM10023091_36730 [Ravibacter arvi]|uniref:Uncharacterized protein n=1 Tax=Ravibacter arvi TaxID=2051041 RepID=A0ABP8M773_9BACT
MGYGLEDPNIDIILGKMEDELGPNRKESFLLSPDLPAPKINELARRGISYINLKGEAFVDELFSNIKDNIYSDFDTGKIDASTHSKFVANFGHLPNYAVKNEKLKITSIGHKNTSYEAKLKFSFLQDDALNGSLPDLLAGKMFELEIPEGRMQAPILEMDGITISRSMTSLTLQLAPVISTTIDIRFDDGFEYFGIPFKAYKMDDAAELRLYPIGATIQIKLPFKSKSDEGINFSLSYTHDQSVKRIKDEIELFELLDRLTKGNRFYAFEKGKQVYSASLDAILEKQSPFEWYLEYFKLLRKIEICYKLTFQGVSIEEVTEQTMQIARRAVASHEGVEMEFDIPGAYWRLPYELRSEEDKVELQSFLGNISNIVMGSKEYISVDLHGHTLSIGFEIQRLMNPIIVSEVNFDIPVMSEIVVKSANEKLLIRYSKEHLFGNTET